MGAMAHEPTQAAPPPGARLPPTPVDLRAREHEFHVPPLVVEIGSVVTVDDADSGGGAPYRVVRSHQAEGRGDVSIGSPIGQAPLGRRASETVAVSLPNGRTRRLRIASVAAST